MAIKGKIAHFRYQSVEIIPKPLIDNELDSGRTTMAFNTARW